MGAAVAGGGGVAVFIWVGVGVAVAGGIGAGFAEGVGSGMSVGAGAAVTVVSGAVVGVSVGGGVATGVGSWVGFAGCVRTGWLSDGAVASGSRVSVGVIMDVGTVSEQATRISRASRAVDSSFAMSVDSPFWSVSGSAFYYTSTCPQPLSPELEERFPLSCLAFRGPCERGLPTVSSNSHRFGTLSMLQKAFDLTRTILESTKDFGLRRGSNGDWAIVVSLMLGRTSESLDAVKLLLCRHLVASRTRPASARTQPVPALPRPTLPALAERCAGS